MTMPLDAVRSAHGRLVAGRRVRALATAIAPLVGQSWHLLDVGAGDGRLADLLRRRVAESRVEGYDVLPRADAAIPVHPFGGRVIPAGDASADAVLLADVLHHTDDPMVLLREAARVARTAVIIKDHRTSRPLARPVLRVMDWAGNRAHGVALPYNYWSHARWCAAFDTLGLRLVHYQTVLGLYPWPADWLFERGLHFVARLDRD